MLAALALTMKLTGRGEFERDKDALIYKQQSYKAKKTYLKTSE